MRIKRIQLSWFRGVSELVNLDLNSESIVIYGENGSGKSSFVDAVEYLIRSGKIGHLSHEYSGRRQEKGIINTHTPEGKETKIEIEFQKGNRAETKIEKNGSNTPTGDGDISQWDYHRTILRQNEVADFISYTKGDKYSALLPLFGLGSLEITAENLRQLEKYIEQESALPEKKLKISLVREKRNKSFGEANDTLIEKDLKKLHESYCTSTFQVEEPLSSCDEINNVLDHKIKNNSNNYTLYKTLLDISQSDITEDIEAVRAESLKLVNEVEPHIIEKLAVLETASSYAQKLDTEDAVSCPACGHKILPTDFRNHVDKEKKDLQKIINAFNNRKKAIGKLCDALKSIKKNLEKTELAVWIKENVEIAYKKNLSYLNSLEIENLRASCTEAELKEIDNNVTPLVEEAKRATKETPPDMSRLLGDQDIVKTIREVFEIKSLATQVKRLEDLVSFISKIQQGIRAEIRSQSQKVIDELSGDIQRMWAVLHPEEKIEHIHLYTSPESDKAIEIGLKFYGVDQESPRLTLSEGHRNSLGLCIFLSMAKREEKNDRPLFLDDVVVSIDRNHRGMIVPLLESEFTNRQVVILTHDREWFIELKQQLKNPGWQFKALMPWESPEIGIRWSAKTSTLDDARAFLKADPDVAGHTARKIMDIELALYAEPLKIRLPYLHREKNDHRMAHDFLERMISDAGKCFEIKKEGENKHKKFDEAVEKFKEADRLLISWANRASHDFTVVRPEAIKLINACEEVLNCFICPSCKKLVSKSEDSRNEIRQCECGTLRWCYGKI